MYFCLKTLTLRTLGTIKKITATESQIIALLQNADVRAIDLIYEKYANALFGMLVVILKDEIQAQDALQVSLVKIWKSGATFDPNKSRLFTWMLNVCRNTALDVLRSKENKNKNQNRNIDDVVRLIDCHTSFTINTDMIGLEKIVQILPEDQQQLINLIYFQGYTQAEVAEYIPMPLGTVKTKLRAAMMFLRKRF